MSYIQAFKSYENSEPYGWSAPVPDDSTDNKILDRDMDDEALAFVRDLISAIDALEEGETLVIRKVIF